MSELIGRRPGWSHLGALAVGVSLLSCGNSPDTKSSLSVESRGSIHGKELVLSHSPNLIAAGAVAADTLVADLVLSEGIGHVIDLTTLPDGTIAVLDRYERALLLFDSAGDHVVSLGRKGDGPGEYELPIAVTAFGPRAVIWDFEPHKVFTILNLAERRYESVVHGNAVAGDWRHLAYRRPFSWEDRPFQWTWEDTSRRLGAWDDSSFVHQLQADERAAAIEGVSFPNAAPPAFLVRYSATGEVLDTVAEMVGPPSVRQPDMPGSYPIFEQPVYAARPLWAVGDDWLALAHGGRSNIDLRSKSGEPIGRISWPDQKRSTGDSELNDFFGWFVSERILKEASEERRREVLAQSKRQLAEGRRIVTEEQFEIADSLPLLTAIYGSGACIALFGFSSSDYADGTALTFALLNLGSGQLLGVFRVPRLGSRVRHFDGKNIFSSYKDDVGVGHIERYPLPIAGCGVSEPAS